MEAAQAKIEELEEKLKASRMRTKYFRGLWHACMVSSLSPRFQPSFNLTHESTPGSPHAVKHHGNSAPWLGVHQLHQSLVDYDSPRNTHTSHRLLTETRPVLGVYLSNFVVLSMVTRVTHLWMIPTSWKLPLVTFIGPRTDSRQSESHYSILCYLGRT